MRPANHDGLRGVRAAVLREGHSRVGTGRRGQGKRKLGEARTRLSQSSHVVHTCFVRGELQRV